MKYRLAKSSDCSQMARIALSCDDALGNGITFQLGASFLRQYYQVVLEEKESVVMVAVDDVDSHRILGFTFGTLDADENMKSLRKNKYRLALAASLAIARRPSLIATLLKRYSATSATSQQQYVIRSGARATFMAMLPEARGGGQGILLLQRWLAVMRQLGAQDIRLEVDADNPLALKIHQLLGATVIKDFVTPSGIHRFFMEYPVAPQTVSRDNPAPSVAQEAPVPPGTGNCHNHSTMQGAYSNGETRV